MKYRIRNHLQSFRIDRPKREKETTLSEQVWDDRRNGIVRDLKWEKITKAKPRGANNKRCNLCDTESLYILHKPEISVNSRSELGGYCPHKRKFILSNINSNKEVKKEEKKAKELIKNSQKRSHYKI